MPDEIPTPEQLRAEQHRYAAERAVKRKATVAADKARRELAYEILTKRQEEHFAAPEKDRAKLLLHTQASALAAADEQLAREAGQAAGEKVVKMKPDAETKPKSK